MNTAIKHDGWHKGAPPHVGWWATVVVGYYSPSTHPGQHWGWWDGEGWSSFASPRVSAAVAAKRASRQGGAGGSTHHVRWSHYWPENARVPRIDPCQEQSDAS